MASTNEHPVQSSELAAGTGAPVQLMATTQQELIPLPSKSRRHRSVWIALVCVALVVIAGIFIRQRQTSQKTPVFETASVVRGSIQAFVTATGNLSPVVNVQVGSQVSGNIKALYADFNTKVQKGQLIAQIDPAIFQTQVDAATASVDQLQAQLASADAQLAKTHADIAVAIANKTSLIAVQAKDLANLTNLQEQWRRSEGLFRQGVVSSQDHDSVRAAFEAAQAQIESDKSQIDSATKAIQSSEAQSSAARAQRGAAEAQLRQAKANLSQALVNLDHTRIVAPVSGTVIARHFDVGQTVAASFQSPDIFDIGEDLTKMQVDTNVDEADVGPIRAGQSADFTVDAYQGVTFHGTVADVRRAPINVQNVVTYDVVIAVPNPDLKLFPGMTAKVTILTQRQENALKVPNAALRFRPGTELLSRIKTSSANNVEGQQIYLSSGSEIKAVPVSTGISDGRFTAVTSGAVNEGDKVILRLSSSKQTVSTPPPSRRFPGT